MARGFGWTGFPVFQEVARSTRQSLAESWILIRANFCDEWKFEDRKMWRKSRGGTEREHRIMVMRLSIILHSWPDCVAPDLKQELRWTHAWCQKLVCNFFRSSRTYSLSSRSHTTPPPSQLSLCVCPVSSSCVLSCSSSVVQRFQFELLGFGLFSNSQFVFFGGVFCPLASVIVPLHVMWFSQAAYFISSYCFGFHYC